MLSSATMADFDDVKQLASVETGLCVVAVTRADGSVHASVVNAGPLVHPRTGNDTVAFVARGQVAKVARVRAVSRASVTFRRGWRWVGVEGPSEVIDSDADAGAGGLSALLRAVFLAAGGTHEDWDEFDRVMAEEKRVAVLVSPERILGP